MQIVARHASPFPPYADLRVSRRGLWCVDTCLLLVSHMRWGQVEVARFEAESRAQAESRASERMLESSASFYDSGW